MIKATDAIRIARSLIGTPYAELDCINLIKKVIRTAPGGVKSYTTAGSNTLWNSIVMSGKYRDLTQRHEGVENVPAGALAFKRYGDNNLGHVGIVTGDGTVIHASSVCGRTVETPLTANEGWDCWAIHRYISTGTSEDAQEGNMQSYRATVNLSNPDSTLNVRNEPGRGGDVINRLFHGQSVTVLAQEENGWAFVQYGDSGQSGYVSGEYLTPSAEEEETKEKIETTTLISELTGDTVMLVGRWKVAQD